jgi:hypothetical protein
MKLEEDELMGYRFKAKEVPKSVKDKERYKELLRKEEDRRLKNKEETGRRLME